MTEPLPSEWPTPIYDFRAQFWPRREATFVYDSEPRWWDNNPRPVAVAPGRIARQLRALASADALDVLRAVRLYASALRIIIEQPDIAYLLLVSTVEALMVAPLSGWVPTEKDQVEHQTAVFRHAKTLGLTDEQARALAVTACRREYWIKRKFVKFITDRTSDELWTDDDLFVTWGVWQPEPRDFEKYLKRIYDSRSGVVHMGERLPSSIGIGTSTRVSADVFHDALSGGLDKTPPVVWFERVVSMSLRARIAEFEQQPASSPHSIKR